MMTPEQAEQFCKKIQKSGKYEGDGTEFVQLTELLRFLADDQDNIARNEYIVDHMSREDYLALSEEYDELEEAERLLESQKNKIRYVADDEKIEMLIPREKIVKMISNLTKAINDNPDAKTYKLTINL